MPYIRVALVGLLVGALYAVAAVRAPAPPLIAIIGLTGMLISATVLSLP